MAKKMKISFQPKAAMIIAPRIGVTTGPNFTADRKMPDAVPFSLGGNQLLIVDVTPMGSGPSARPRPMRHSFIDHSEPTKPVRPVVIDVRIIEIGKTLRTPNRDSSHADGSCATP